MARIIAVLAAFAGMLAAVPAEAADRIEWRLENPFRLFKDAKDTALHAEAFRALGAAERGSPILSAERRLEERFGGRGWAEKVVNNTCYDQDGDRHSACQDYILPKSHRIVASLVRQRRIWDFLAEPTFEETCNWRLTDMAGKPLKEARALCRHPVTFDVPWPKGGRLSVAKGAGTSAPAAAVAIKVHDVLVVGLGDSFGAGEGNPDAPVKFDDTRDLDYGTVEIAATGQLQRLDGYPAREGGWRDIESPGFQRERARWLDKECHRSLYSHQLRAALQLAVENPQRAITFVGLACSGAEIVQGLLLPKPVRECTPGDHYASPAQLSQLSEELCRSVKRGAQMPAALLNRMPELRSVAEDEMRVTRCEAGGEAGLKRPIDLVLLSIGGNDIGFTPIVSDSILGEQSIYRRLGIQTGAVYGVDGARERARLVRQRFEGLRFALEQFFQVRSNGGQAPVLITGYPHMGYGEDGLSACGGDKGLEVFPPFHLDAAKVGKAEDFTEQLNTGLKAVSGLGWTYVNGFRADFRQHGLCAVNGGPDEMLGFPRRRNGVWVPFKPSEYKPYTPRQRWFRTPNDAFLAANMHADQFSSFGANCSGLYSAAFKLLARKHWRPFQVFLASTHGGAFHPTAEGQARIADEVATAARAILDRAP